MKILLSAMACEPGNGSELEVGFRAMLGAAREHDVWVLTNKDSIPALQRVLSGRPEERRIRLEGIDFGVGAEGIALLTIPGFHYYYDRWQRHAAARAVQLDRQIDFDVVHHVTLASYWTRAGVAEVDKPLIWGPVGGGVEPPWPLLRELGWAGLIEDAGRVVIRRLLGRFGPARRAQRRAVVTFAQNTATRERIRTPGRISVVTNATVIDLVNRQVAGERSSDVLVIGRLIGWKGPVLALRAFRHIRHPQARLIFCGSGPQGGRVLRAARKWGLADRIQIEGWLPRQALLTKVATAGVVLHTALHEEAGLCVAEALSLGTPVVCLDHGGPPQVLRQWPATPSTAVTPADPETTALRLAAAVDAYLAAPPPVASSPTGPATPFEQQLLTAYNEAVGAQRPMVWGFPRGKSQLFADSPLALSNGVMVYAFGRRLPRLAQTAIAIQIRLPGVRRLLCERKPQAEPICGQGAWREIAAAVRRRNPGLSGEWVHISSQWEKRRSSFVGLDAQGNPALFLTIAASDTAQRNSLASTTSYRVPAYRNSFRHADGWWVNEVEPLPRFHRPARWDPNRLQRVVADIAQALTFPRPAGIPSHWVPIHGDLVPWNLREDDTGQFWLLDWEDASWGPPLSDVVRYVVAYYSLGWRTPKSIASEVRSILAGQSADAIREVGRFWLNHHNVQPGDWPQQRAKDAARKSREAAAFRELAGE